MRLLLGTESDMAYNPFLQKIAGTVGAQALTTAGTLDTSAETPLGAATAKTQDDSKPSAVGAQTGM